MDKQTCATCRFRYGQEDGWSGYAQCRRYPPTNERHSHGGPVSVWPQTDRRDWCGEHQPKDSSADRFDVTIEQTPVWPKEPRL